MKASKKEIFLKSSSIDVQIDQPGSRYCGSRFDWSGFIRQMVYRGRKLCTVESKDPNFGSGGAGLCSEFGLHRLPQYEECQPGGLFPKIGVGWLRKEKDEPKSPLTEFKIEKPVNISIEREDETTVCFVSELPEHEGISCISTRRITLEDQILRQEITLENCGQTTLETDEYCHNFLSLDAISGKEHYDLIFPAAESMISRQGDFHWREGRLWRTSGMNGVIYAQMQPKENLGEDILWRLVHWPTGLTIADTSQLQTDLFAVWGMDHVISPEVFMTVKLQPGEKRTWVRRMVIDVV